MREWFWLAFALLVLCRVLEQRALIPTFLGDLAQAAVLFLLVVDWAGIGFGLALAGAGLALMQVYRAMHGRTHRRSDV